MLIVSCRKNLWSNDEIGNGPDAIINVNMENKDDEGTPITEKDFCARVEGKKVLLLVHGYNNSRENVQSAYRIINEMQEKLVGFHNLLIGYTWPGGIGEFNYKEPRDRTPNVIPRFLDLLVVLNQNVQSIDIMSHSLGCRISLATLETLVRNNVDLNTLHRQFLMAAAIDSDSIERGKPFFQGSSCGKSCHVFHSEDDGALSVVTYGSQENSTALGYSGPNKGRDIKDEVHGIDCRHVLRGTVHSAYKSTSEVYEYIRKVVNGEEVSRWMSFPEDFDDPRWGGRA